MTGSLSVRVNKPLLPPAIRRMGEGNSFSPFTFRGGYPVSDFLGGRGGPRSQIFKRGVPSLRFSGGGVSLVSDFLGGGSPVSNFWGGVPSVSKGKNF